MSATPIPRTLAMTMYADLDVSVIDELPPGRTAFARWCCRKRGAHRSSPRIEEACRAGRQAYWVCPLIEESEELDARRPRTPRRHWPKRCRRARRAAARTHGAAAEGSRSCSASRPARLQLLVATTVIEVGVDVPNASLMVIENAERMGLAQLHQLRGRVGRGAHESSCVLLYRAPLSQMARARLAAIRDSNDGFQIARRDLELRGPGELLGRRQTGLAQLRVADLSATPTCWTKSRGGRADDGVGMPERVALCGCAGSANRSSMDASADGALTPRRRAACRTGATLRRALALAQLMRLDRPIGIWLLLWPTLWALWIAGAGHPLRRLLGIFMAGTVVMRSAGCVINDLADRNIDPHVRRTRVRPLAARIISPYEALVLFAVLSAIALLLALRLNLLTIELAFVGAALTISYPLLKRFFPLPQLYLGLCFGWAVPMAFAATLGYVPREGWLLLVAAVLWAGIYDTMYAMVDRDDDLRIGVQSTAILFADLDRLLSRHAGHDAAGAGAARSQPALRRLVLRRPQRRRTVSSSGSNG